jgi:hypothetical protein
MSYFYYADDGACFASKINALNYSSKTGHKIYTNYYDNVYSTLNWKQEPPLSLYEYYVLQAKRIRDTYDKVIMFFSGGHDSTQILEIFHKNNIKLDKIVIVGSFKQDENSNSNANQNIEAYKNAFPYVEKLGLSNICEKVDYTDYFNDISKQLTIVKYDSEWIDQVGTRFSPTHLVWRQIEEIVVPNSWRDRKTALIFGMERTTLYYENGKYGFKFSDKTVNGLGNFYKTDYSDRIYFFWDPTFPNIIVKQLHLLYRAAQSIRNNTKVSIENAIAILNKNVYDLEKKENGGLKSLHYDIDINIKYKSPKNTNCLLSKKDAYIERYKSEKIYDFYQSGILNMRNRLICDDRNYDSFSSLINKTIYSKFYSIN